MRSAMRPFSVRSVVGHRGHSVLVVAVALAFSVAPMASSADEMGAMLQRIFCQTDGAIENAHDELVVASPNGRVRCVVAAEKGQLTLAIQRDGAPILEPSPIRISVDGQSLTVACQIAAS